MKLNFQLFTSALVIPMAISMTVLVEARTRPESSASAQIEAMDSEVEPTETAAPIKKKMNTQQAERLWKQALQAGIDGKTSKAGALLQQLLDSNQTAVSEDLITITAARLFYQNNALDKAVEYYNQVSRTSDYWLEAIEEKAWAFARKKDYDNAQGELQTLMVPLLAPQIGPEPYLTQAFVDLKICNYKGIFDTLKLFKERYQPRAESMTQLSKNAQTPFVSSFFDRLQSTKVTQAKLGADAEKLPRLVHRDQKLKLALKSGDRQTAYARVKELASADVEEIGRILKRMQIIEVEAIQRMHGTRPASNKGSLKDQNVTKDQLKFPYSGEVWLDELDHYKVSSTGCEAQGG